MTYVQFYKIRKKRLLSSGLGYTAFVKMEIWEQYWVECGVSKERCKVIWSAAKRAADVLPKLEES